MSKTKGYHINLRTVRIVLAVLFFTGISLLFLDFTGLAHAWLGWMAKVQFMPAVLAINVGVIIMLLAMTLLLGRVYCSVICPLGVMQDIFGWLGKKHKRNRYRYSRPKHGCATQCSSLWWQPSQPASVQ